MVKVWFPSMFLRLISVNLNKKPAQALLHIPPSMTKTEVKEYLTKIYDIPVLSVSTTNMLGVYPTRLRTHSLTSRPDPYSNPPPSYTGRQVEALLRQAKNSRIQAAQYQKGDSGI